MTRRVLLIDDDDMVREVAQASLELVAGWTVDTADGGERGLEIARDDPPEAILLDVMMPGIDGPATLERLRATPGLSDIPVVFLTAKALDQETRHLMSLDAQGVITKPFDPMTLHSQIMTALGW